MISKKDVLKTIQNHIDANLQEQTVAGIYEDHDSLRELKQMESGMRALLLDIEKLHSTPEYPDVDMQYNDTADEYIPVVLKEQYKPERD